MRDYIKCYFVYNINQTPPNVGEVMSYDVFGTADEAASYASGLSGGSVEVWETFCEVKKVDLIRFWFPLAIAAGGGTFLRDFIILTQLQDPPVLGESPRKSGFNSKTERRQPVLI
jgi:hypothetical protein